jgi:hypothetical protein
MDNPPMPDLSSDTEEPVPTVPIDSPEIDQPLSADVIDVAQSTGGARPTVTFQGNTYDLSAVIGVTVSAFTLLTCMTCNFAYYLLPCLTIVFGIFGLVTASNAVDAERTKQLSWITIGAGLVIILLITVFMLAYVGLFFLIAVSSGDFSF